MSTSILVRRRNLNLCDLLQNIYFHKASKPKCDIQKPSLAIVGILIHPLHLFISCCLCSCSSCFSSHPCSCSYFYFSSRFFCSSSLCSLTSCLCCGISSCPSSSWSGWERRTWSVLKVKQDLSSFEITRKLTCCQTFLSSASSRPCHHHHSHFLMSRHLCLSWNTQLHCCSRIMKQIPACCWNIGILTIAPGLWWWPIIGDELFSLELLNKRYSNICLYAQFQPVSQGPLA